MSEQNTIKLKDFVNEYGNGDIEEYLILSEDFSYRCFTNVADAFIWIFEGIDNILNDIRNDRPEMIPIAFESIEKAVAVLREEYLTPKENVKENNGN